MRVDFSRANLNECNFRQAILRDTDLSDAYLYNADLTAADFRWCKLNIATPVRDIRGVRPWLAEKISLAQYWSDHSIDTKNWLIRMWFAATMYGTSLSGVLLLSASVVLMFGVCFYAFQEIAGEVITGSKENIFGMIAFAAENFLNSGPTVASTNQIIRWFVIANVALGVGALGLFIAVLARKLIVHLP
jgi:hypothetical protein